MLSQIHVRLACVALQKRNSCELLKLLLEVLQVSESHDTERATEDLGRIKLGSTLNEAARET